MGAAEHFLTLLFALSFEATYSFPTDPTEVYPYSETLSGGKYILYWKHNDTHITFETHVKTLGWVGLGLSGNGKMLGADVVIGYVKDGKPYLKDRSVSTYYIPPDIDAQQDWFLISGKEVDDTTVLKFERALDTCDTAQDFAITKDLIYVIFAWNDNDPEPLNKHEAKGAKQLYLIDPISPKVKLPANVNSFMFESKETKLPTKQTYYGCTAYVFPTLDKKHHAIAFEPVIEKGNEDIVHHFIIRACEGTFPDANNGTSYECYENPPEEYKGCYLIFGAWASGGKTFYLPEETGLPIGVKDSLHFIFEVHFNNEQNQAGRVDSSGMRVYYTPELRQYDTGILQLGVQVTPLQVIPPKYKSFVSRGVCSAECLRNGMSDGVDQLTIVGAMLHSHLLGIKLRLRHLRNGEELEPLFKDDNYDFDFQQVRSLRELRTVKATDTLIMECVYDSSDKTTLSIGGLGTNQEMCLTFMYYYPALSKLKTCESYPTYDTGHVWWETYQYTEGLSKKYDWGNALSRQKFQCDVDKSEHLYKCKGENYEEEKFGPPPEIKKPYVGNNRCSVTPLESRDPCGDTSMANKVTASLIVELMAMLSIYL